MNDSQVETKEVNGRLMIFGKTEKIHQILEATPDENYDGLFDNDSGTSTLFIMPIDVAKDILEKVG
jgi:hypothetical protein